MIYIDFLFNYILFYYFIIMNLFLLFSLFFMLFLFNYIWLYLFYFTYFFFFFIALLCVWFWLHSIFELFIIFSCVTLSLSFVCRCFILLWRVAASELLWSGLYFRFFSHINLKVWSCGIVPLAFGLLSLTDIKHERPAARRHI